MDAATRTTPTAPLAALAALGLRAVDGLSRLAPLADLLLRLWVAKVFWDAGVNKIQSWDTTLMLFTYEYQVPLLSPTLAAYAGTATELIAPVLLALGLGGRFAALWLFVFNVMAVVSYPTLNPAGVVQHQVWGIMLLVSLLHGPGALSLDHLIRHRLIRS